MAASEIDPLDFLEIDTLLSEEERALRDRVRSFVHEHILPHIEDWFERGVFARELAPEFGKLGVLGMHLEGYGCPGGTDVDYGLACLEIEAGDSGIRSFTSVQGSLVMFVLHSFGSEEHKQEWLPRLASGEAIGCFSLTERDSGSDPASMTTFAKRDGSDWLLNGEKRWATNGTASDLAIVWAQTEEGIRGFVIPRETPGFQIWPIDRKLSLRAAAGSGITLENVRLPAESVLPGVVGLRGPLSALTEARYGIVWGAMGAARSCFESALGHAKSRVQFGKPIGSFQLIQERLVEMALELNKGMLLAVHLGRMKDEGRARPEHISMGKLNNARAALDIARRARALHGGDGITFDHPVIRHMNNLESVLTYEGTEEVQTLIVGQALTGLRAFT
jgi:glutaryl-CoA dehydrogenase